MKKQIIILATACAVCLLSALVIKRVAGATDGNGLLKQNLEALADYEHGSSGDLCYNTITTKTGHHVLYCQGCVWLDGKKAPFSGSDYCK